MDDSREKQKVAMIKEAYEAGKGWMMGPTHWAAKVFMLLMHLLPAMTVLKSKAKVLRERITIAITAAAIFATS